MTMNLNLNSITDEELVITTNQLENPSELEQVLAKRLEVRLNNSDVIRQMLEDIEERL